MYKRQSHAKNITVGDPLCIIRMEKVKIIILRMFPNAFLEKNYIN